MPISKKPPIEHRHAPLRRQWNEAFCDPDGHFSIAKFLAVWTQIKSTAEEKYGDIHAARVELRQGGR